MGQNYPNRKVAYKQTLNMKRKNTNNNRNMESGISEQKKEELAKERYKRQRIATKTQ